MANIVLRNGWNQPATYKNVASVTFQTDVEGVTATYYENGSGGSGGLGAQANWVQNNIQAADYIKNRPFYSSYKEIIAPITIELIDNGDGLYGAVLGEPGRFNETEYTVIWGDDLWFCDVVEKEGKKYLGNLNLVGITTEATEGDTPPFVGVYEDGLLTFYSDSAVTLTIGLGGPEIIHKINAKYLPDGIMGNADWNAKEGEPGYIANKPTSLGLDIEALDKYLDDEKYVTEEYVTKELTEFRKEIPSIEGLATIKYVDEELKELSDKFIDYATIDWVTENFVTPEQLLLTIEMLANVYATKTELAEVKTALENYKKEVNTKFQDTQADWNIEDESNLAAIKNKPFGIYADLIPNISYSEDSFIRVNNSNGLLVYKLQTGLALTNTQYEVIWNGDKFVCVPDIKTSGAPFLLSMDGSFTTETFPSGKTTITLKLLDNIYRLDKKFLPKDVATEEYVDDKIGEIEQSNWNETDPNSKAYIANKPEVVQADWKATNSSSMAYIKNKPEVVQADWNVTNTSSMAFIKNKPQVVQSDWNATSGMAFIKNKPTIPDAQVPSDWAEEDSSKVSFIKNKPTIPDPQVHSDWGEEDPTKISFIKNKPNFFSDWGATEGRSRIVNMPAVFRHSTAEENVEEILIDTISGWKKQAVEKLTMTVTFEDDSVKTYSIVGREVIK
jgi:hypothetical protein